MPRRNHIKNLLQDLQPTIFVRKCVGKFIATGDATVHDTVQELTRVSSPAQDRFTSAPKLEKKNLPKLSDFIVWVN